MEPEGSLPHSQASAVRLFSAYKNRRQIIKIR